MAVTITNPHAVAWIVRFEWLASNQDRAADQDENDESPRLIEEEFELALAVREDGSSCLADIEGESP